MVLAVGLVDLSTQLRVRLEEARQEVAGHARLLKMAFCRVQCAQGHNAL